MNKIISIVQNTIQHEMISGSLYVFLGFIFTSFFSFLFNLFLARSLTYSNYGEYSSLLSIYTLATIPAASLGVIVIRFATSYFTNNEKDKLSTFYKKMLLFWSIVSLVILLLYVLISQETSSFLKINDRLPVLMIGVAIALSYLSISTNSFLQALTRFRTLSISSAIGAFSKLVIGAFLVVGGFKVLGATLGILLSPLVTFLIGLIPLKFLLTHKSSSRVTLHSQEMVKYGLPAALCILFLSSYISSDVLLVKHFFSTVDAGYYGGLSLVGKVIFYFTGPIPMVMFPLIIKRQSLGKNFKNLLYISFVLVLIPAVLITGFYFIAPEFSIKFFLGGRDYLKMAPYLGLFGIFLSIYSINNIIVNFFLALKKTKVVYFVAIGALLQIILIFSRHKDFNQIINASILSSVFLLIVLLIYYIKAYGIHNSSK